MTLPFRLKLTIWYSTLLAGAVILFSTAVYLLMAHALLDNLNASLRVRADQVGRSADVRNGQLGLSHRDEQSEGQFIPAALLGSTGRITSGPAPASLNSWLASHGDWLRPGFHATGVADFQVASRSIDRHGRVVGYVLVWQPREAADNARHSLLLVILTMGPVLLVVAGLGGWALAGRALAPVVRVTETASAISGSDLSRRVEVGPTQDELSRLAATFNAMIDRLQAAVERERRFTADASHELRAPLAVIRAEATLALDRPRSPDEYQRALALIDDQAEAEQELITELLSLARADSASAGERQIVPFNRAVAAAVDQCRLLREQAGVSIDVRMAEDLPVKASLPLLTRAIRNIIDNAIRVSRPGDTIRVQAWREGERVIMTVEDSGPGIPPEHQVHIFDPFYQVSAARTPGESHGLGLAICKRIVDAYGGNVEVNSIPGSGARFRIDLPAASLPAGIDEPVSGSALSGIHVG
jgi:signal transduction histidine kinase